MSYLSTLKRTIGIHFEIVACACLDTSRRAGARRTQPHPPKMNERCAGGGGVRAEPLAKRAPRKPPHGFPFYNPFYNRLQYSVICRAYCLLFKIICGSSPSRAARV